MGRLAKARLFGLLVSFGLGASAPSAALATTITFTRIVDLYTLIPGGDETFASDTLRSVSVDGTAVAFQGGHNPQGIYSTAGGSLHAVAVQGDPIPGGSGGFRWIEMGNFEDGLIPFSGSGSGIQEGVYIADAVAGGSALVADLGTAIPGGAGNFPGFTFRTDYSAGEALFQSRTSTGIPAGIYRGVLGSLSVVIDPNTPVSGGADGFSSIRGGTISNGQVALWTDGAIYSTSDDGLVVVAGPSTAIPGGVGNFAGFAGPVVSDGTILFRGTGAENQQGIYVSSGGALSVVADQSMSAPGGIGTFTEFAYAYAIDDGAVVFSAADSAAQWALYTTHGGSLFRVVGAGDTLDGETVYFVDLGFDAISGNTIGFVAYFRNGNTGVFTATIPEPSPMGLLAIALLALGARAAAHSSR